MSLYSKKFENVHVPYMMNQARMCFAVVAMYPAYKFEGTVLVRDESEYATKLREDCKHIAEVIANMIKREHTGKPIPKTWKKRVLDQMTLVEALRECRVVCKDWYDEYQRLTRYITAG